MIQRNIGSNIQSVTLEILIKKFKKSDLSAFPNVYNYATKLEPILWILWVIQKKIGIEAHIPASMLADILVDGIGKSSDKNLVKKALARAGNKINRKFMNGEHTYKIMKDGIQYLKNLEENKEKSTREKIYKQGEQYDVYKNLKDIMKKSSNEVFIVDAYPDESLYELYINSIPHSVPVKILTKRPSQKAPRSQQDIFNKFIAVGKLLSKNRSIEIKESSQVHDRYIFVDDKCWMLGASIKDAGSMRPTVLVKLDGRNEMYGIWRPLFNSGIILL